MLRKKKMTNHGKSWLNSRTETGWNVKWKAKGVKVYGGGSRFLCFTGKEIFRWFHLCPVSFNLCTEGEGEGGKGESGHIPSFLANFYTQSRGTMKYSVAHARLTADLVKNRIFISIKFIRVAGSTSPSLAPFSLFFFFRARKKLDHEPTAKTNTFAAWKVEKGGGGERGGGKDTWRGGRVNFSSELSTALILYKFMVMGGRERGPKTLEYFISFNFALVGAKNNP